MLNFKKIGKKNICLIGLMGSGKSLIGKELSIIMNSKFYDSDLEIEKHENLSISLIFQKYGENYFRKIEEEICLKLLPKSNSVISLGGGSIINEKIRNLIREFSYSIYLKVDIDVLLKRLNNSNRRPLLKDTNKRNKLEKLFKKREKFYNSANLIIENNHNKKDVLNKIKSHINLQ